MNTLDQLLGAIAQLNPHVNIKAIVIGLMDRLSAYAARESESEPPENRQKTEEESTAKLLEKLWIAKETKKSDSKAEGAESIQTNGTPVNGDTPAEASQDVQQQQQLQRQSSKEDSETPNGVGNGEKSSSRKRGIPENVELYNIFYEQVIHLVNAQRLHVQDTIALLVSLTNLAL